MPGQGTRWCFTLNNPTSGEEGALADLLDSDHVRYGVYGRETGEEGTPHFQGFVIFTSNRRFNNVKALLGDRYHIELARGTNKQADDYCKKDGNFNTYGDMPSSTPKNSRWEQYRDWLKSLDNRPTELEILEAFPSLYGQYRNAALRFRDLLCPLPTPPQEGTLREWQQSLQERLLGDPDDRSIHFLVDEVGNSGKTWFARYWLRKYPEETQVISAAKRDDMAHAIDPDKKYFFVNVARSQMEYLSYAVLEALKDQIVFSPKYDSTTKILTHVPHVVVFCNEEPDITKLSEDRFDIVRF